MVLEEAKILNKLIIITDTAAREAIEKYENSIILENTKESIYEGIKKVIKENNLYKKENEVKDYDNSKILQKVINLIEK